jgi:hypothetical protein
MTRIKPFKFFHLNIGKVKVTQIISNNVFWSLHKTCISLHVLTVKNYIFQNQFKILSTASRRAVSWTI